MSHQLTITVHPESYAICRLNPDAAVPAWAGGAALLSVTRTPLELSIVCEDTMVPESAHSERNRRLLQIEGTLAFALTGVLASVAEPLARAEISIFAVSTYDTDYLLVSEKDLPQAMQVLEAAGHTVRQPV
ncbi:MAG TPA: ACT domain-containing protein [Candidatus Eisenbacteria bacterium]|nr:ACT domain-containing protein [Candidatus Eisenbacteria bacterium]